MAAGTHILIDCYGKQSQMDGEQLDELMSAAASAANATILSRSFHRFGCDQLGNGGGWTGVLVLAESHITVHTWPENNYASFDIYLCGNCDAQRAADIIETYDSDADTHRLSIERGGEAKAMVVA